MAMLNIFFFPQVGYRCDYSYMLQSLAHSNPPGALEFAKQLAGASLVDPNQVVELFMASNRIQETTAFLLEALKGNKPEEGYLQTKLLEVNLRGGSPQVADAILQNKMFSHYDRVYIGKVWTMMFFYGMFIETLASSSCLCTICCLLDK